MCFDNVIRWFSIGRYLTLVLFLFLLSYVFLPSAKAVNNFFYVFMALPGLCILLRSPWSIDRISMLAWFWCLFFIWLLLGGVGAGSFQYLKHWFYVVLFCLVVARFVEFRFFRCVRFHFFIFLFFVCYVYFSACYYWWAGVYPVGARVDFLPMRLSGPTYTSILLVALFALLGATLVRRSQWVFFLICLVVVLFGAGYILQSRAGVVGVFLVAGGALLYFLLKSSSHLVRFVVFLCMTGVFVFLIWIFSSHPVFERLLARADAGRFELWGAYYQAFLRCPTWFGCHPERLADITIQGGRVLIEHPHNVFLSVLFFNGWVGLLLFFGALFLTLKCAWLQKNPWGCFLLASLSMLMFDGSRLINQPNELWLLVLLPSMLILAEASSGGSASGKPVQSVGGGIR